ncbi:MAG TPA: hypothetical protein PLB25_06590 [Rhodoferax sp.]|nr:hypothetical protein [Rhodoferax sp.]
MNQQQAYDCLPGFVAGKHRRSCRNCVYGRHITPATLAHINDAPMQCGYKFCTVSAMGICYAFRPGEAIDCTSQAHLGDQSNADATGVVS